MPPHCRRPGAPLVHAAWVVGAMVGAFATVALLIVAVVKFIAAMIVAAAKLLVAAVKFTFTAVKASAAWMKTVGSKLITAVKAGYSQASALMGKLGVTWGSVAKGAGLNAAWSGIQTARHGGGMTDILKSMGRGAVIGAIGAVTGAFMHGLGAKAGSFASGGGSFTGTALHAAAHGVSGGAMAAANGGSFKDGFIGGAIGFGTGLVFAGPQTAAGGMPGLAGVAVRTTIAAIGGGVGSKLSGGSFSDGAYSAAFFHLFNAENGSFSYGLTKGLIGGAITGVAAMGIIAVFGTPAAIVLGALAAISIGFQLSHWIGSGFAWNPEVAGEFIGGALGGGVFGRLASGLSKLGGAGRRFNSWWNKGDSTMSPSQYRELSLKDKWRYEKGQNSKKNYDDSLDGLTPLQRAEIYEQRGDRGFSFTLGAREGTTGTGPTPGARAGMSGLGILGSGSTNTLIYEMPR